MIDLCTVFKSNLGIILEHPPVHGGIAGALTFQMIADGKNTGYSETAVRNPFVTFSILLSQEMLVGTEINGFLPGIHFPENFVEKRMNQITAIIEYCSKNVVVRCTACCHM